MPVFRLPEMHEESRSVILPSAMIPVYGFGTGKMSRYVNGIYKTEIVRRTYRLACSCVIEKESELGPPCVQCQMQLESLITQAIQAGSQVSLTPEQLDYACCSCVRHSFRCSVQFCPHFVCRGHAAMLPDGGALCPEHFLAMDLESRIAASGPLVFRAKEFLRGLFHLGDPK